MPVGDDAYRSCGEGAGFLFVCLFVFAVSWDESFVEQVFLPLPPPPPAMFKAFLPALSR